MARYKVTITIEAARQQSVEKKLRQAFGNQVQGISWNVEKVKTAESRADRFAEAQSMVEDGKNIVEELKDEMEQWRDSVPENLQGGDKYQEVETACDQLDSIQSDLDGIDWSVDFPGMF